MTGHDLLEQLVRRARADMCAEFKLHPMHPAIGVEHNMGVYIYLIDDTEVTCSEAAEALEAAYDARQTSFGLKAKQANTSRV